MLILNGEYFDLNRASVDFKWSTYNKNLYQVFVWIYWGFIMDIIYVVILDYKFEIYKYFTYNLQVLI